MNSSRFHIAINSIMKTLLTETGLATLTFRRQKHTLVLLLRIKSEVSPSDPSSGVPYRVSTNFIHNFRNANNIETIKRIPDYTTSITCPRLFSWNKLSKKYRTRSTKLHSKDANIVLPPDHYNAGKRLGQVYHVRLRTRCCSLNKQLFRKKKTKNKKKKTKKKKKKKKKKKTKKNKKKNKKKKKTLFKAHYVNARKLKIPNIFFLNAISATI